MATTRRLSMFNALNPYLGSKRRLCSTLLKELDRLLPRRLWSNLTFVDGFLGGGSVSLYAKAQGLNVLAFDVAERAMVTGKALIENTRVLLTREDVLRIAAPSSGRPGRIEREFTPDVFTQAQGRFLDNAFAVAASTPDQTRAALIRLLAIRVMLIIHPMSQVRKGTIGRVTSGDFENITPSCVPRYIESLRVMRPEPLWHLAQRINCGVFQGRASVQRRSIIEALPTLVADVVYWDPPYINSLAYEREYRVVDQILEGEPRAISPFTSKDGTAMLDSLFERAAHIPVWILSYGNVGVGSQDLVERMQRFGRETRALEIRYQHLPAVATEEKKQMNRELLVVGCDPSSALLKDRTAVLEGATR